MTIYEQIINKETKLSVIGLGYVGMPIAVAFAKVADVIGFDNNESKIELYHQGIDPTKEVGDEAIKATTLEFTSDAGRLKEALFHIVSVPTPINQDKTPNLNPVESATRTIGKNLSKGSIVVYESTVYPGVTEDVCIPILEAESGLKHGIDFAVGYSPERINPGDKVHTLENIIKIVSATTDEALEEIAKVYGLVIKAGVQRAPSIKVAEAAKVVENSQRDINIAFMNELALVFDRMGIDSKDVIDAMNTKWNALGFTPGLVGGHCIGVDPYYFVYEAENLGYHSQIIKSGREINDSMGEFIADKIIKGLIKTGKKVIEAKVVVLGLTFKENTPDTRNSKVGDILKRLAEYDIKPEIVDPWASETDALKEYGVTLSKYEDIQDADCVVLAVGHEEFRALSNEDIEALYNQELANEERVLVDIKSILDHEQFTSKGYVYWRL